MRQISLNGLLLIVLITTDLFLSYMTLSEKQVDLEVSDGYEFRINCSHDDYQPDSGASVDWWSGSPPQLVLSIINGRGCRPSSSRFNCDGHTLVISEIVPEDKYFRCETVSTPVVSISFTLHHLLPPSAVRLSCNDSLIFSEGQLAYVKCVVPSVNPGNEATQFDVLMNRTKLKVEDDKVEEKSLLDTNIKIFRLEYKSHIKVTRKLHLGHLTCMVTWKQGSPLEHVIESQEPVILRVQHPPLNVSSSTSVTISENHRATLWCHVTESWPAPAVRWFVGDQPATGSASVRTENAPGGGLNSSFSLLLHRSMSGKPATCRVSWQNRLILEQNINLNVTYPPLLRISPDLLTLTEGQRLSLTCETRVAGNPDVLSSHYKWFLNNEETGLDYTNQTNNVLTLTNVTYRDAGNYTCQGHHPSGVSKSDIALVIVQFSPRLIFVTQEKETVILVIHSLPSPNHLSVTQHPEIRVSCSSDRDRHTCSYLFPTGGLAHTVRVGNNLGEILVNVTGQLETYLYEINAGPPPTAESSKTSHWFILAVVTFVIIVVMVIILIILIFKARQTICKSCMGSSGDQYQMPYGGSTAHEYEEIPSEAVGIQVDERQVDEETQAQSNQQANETNDPVNPPAAETIPLDPVQAAILRSQLTDSYLHPAVIRQKLKRKSGDYINMAGRRQQARSLDQISSL